MAQFDGPPELIHHWLLEKRKAFSMHCMVHEAHVLTTTYPVKELKCVVKNTLHLPYVGSPSSQRATIDAMPLDQESVDALSINEICHDTGTTNLVLENLKTRVLFWNTTGNCPCRYRDIIPSMFARGKFDVVVIMGGATDEAASSSLWSSLRLEGSLITNFGGHGPNALVKWDEEVVDTYVSEGHVIDPFGASTLTVEVDRFGFCQTLLDAASAGSSGSD